MNTTYAVAVRTTGGRRRYLGRARFSARWVWRRSRHAAIAFPDAAAASRAGRAEAANAALAAEVTVFRVDQLRDGRRWHAQAVIEPRATGAAVPVGVATATLARVRPSRHAAP